MKKHFWKIAFIACLVMSAIFAVLLISSSIIMSHIEGGELKIKFLNSVITNTALLFIFGIGAIIFKSIEVCKKEKNKDEGYNG